jgi:hypothetical protein
MVLLGAALTLGVKAGVYRYILLEITEVATDSKTSTHTATFCVCLWLGAALPLSTQRRRVRENMRLVRDSLFTAECIFIYVALHCGCRAIFMLRFVVLFDFVFLFAFDKLTLSISDETEIDKGFWIQK